MTYYTYYFIVGGRIVHGGITIDTQRRQQEHQQTWACRNAPYRWWANVRGKR